MMNQCQSTISRRLAAWTESRKWSRGGPAGGGDCGVVVAGLDVGSEAGGGGAFAEMARLTVGGGPDGKRASGESEVWSGESDA